MKLKIHQVASLLLVSALLLSSLLVFTPKVSAAGEPTAIVTFIPAHVDINNVGDTFTVALVVEGVYNLSGLDIKFFYNTEYLQYVSHTQTKPVESYPAPNPPSPYGGIIHSPPLELRDDVNETEGSYWAAFSTLGGPSFNGSGTVVVMTFQAIKIPYDFEIAPATYIDTYLNLASVDLARSTPAGGGPHPYNAVNGVVRIHAQPLVYPPWPMLKVADKELGLEPPADEVIDGTPNCSNCEFDVYLCSKNETTGEYIGVDGFWDIGGIDVYLHFNTTLLEAVNAQIDPDGWFASFFTYGISWPPGIPEINNAEGWVHLVVNGIEPFTPVSGIGRLFAVEFHALYDSDVFPPPTEPLWLDSPPTFTGGYGFDAIGGLIDINSPEGTTWHELWPEHCDGPFTAYDWEDDGDGELGPGDQMKLYNNATDYYFDYLITDIHATLNVSQIPAPAFEDYAWVANFGDDGLANNGLPGRTLFAPSFATGAGFGDPYLTGNFSLLEPFIGVNQVNCTYMPFGPGEYTVTLTAGVDYAVHVADQRIELLNPVDTAIINEHWKDGVNNTLNGWPWIMYVASGIQSVFVNMNNGTARYGRNYGYAMPPPSEWWFDFDWPWELEGWWALGYFAGPWNWPAGSDWWINYTSASYLSIDYIAGDPNPRYFENNGTYADFLAMGNPINSTWDEAFPRSWRDYEIVNWTDPDVSTDLTAGDTIITNSSGAVQAWYINEISTDISTLRKPWVSEEYPDPVADPFFGVPVEIEMSSFAHPDRDFSPWFGDIYAPRVPCNTEEGYFEAFFAPPGPWIDLYVCDGTRPDPYGGQGPHEPSDMFWPQKAVTLCANVTYNFWPEQYKDVAFHIYTPDHELYAILYNKTDSEGHAVVTFRLPWPCDEWPDVIGVWHIEAYVDVACVVINDTLEFHYDYLVNVVNVQTDEDVYKHCEYIYVTVDFTSHSQMYRNVTITVTIVDETGVPFGYAETMVTIGGAVFCQAKLYRVVLPLHVVKWARAGQATIYAGSLTWLGDPAGPVFEPPPTVGILAEWA